MTSPDLFSKDKKFHAAIHTVELEPIVPADDYFNYLIRSVTFQQLSGKAGATIHGRFLGLFGEKPPAPPEVMAKSHEVLRSVGLSNQKATYIRNIAEFWEKERLTKAALDGMDDDALIAYLSSIKGVGRWTVEVFLMFGMGRPDLFPLDDLGIQQGFALIYGLDTKDLKALKAAMMKRSETWRPNRSLAARYIWAWKDSRKL